MLDLLEKFKEIVSAYRIVSYEQDGNSYRIKAEINLVDDSQYLPTFPHHKHVGTNVLESRETTLEEVLLRIAEERKGRK